MLRSALVKPVAQSNAVDYSASPNSEELTDGWSPSAPSSPAAVMARRAAASLRRWRPSRHSRSKPPAAGPGSSAPVQPLQQAVRRTSDRGRRRLPAGYAAVADQRRAAEPWGAQPQDPVRERNRQLRRPPLQNPPNHPPPS